MKTEQIIKHGVYELRPYQNLLCTSKCPGTGIVVICTGDSIMALWLDDLKPTQRTVDCMKHEFFRIFKPCTTNGITEKGLERVQMVLPEKYRNYLSNK